MKRYVWIIIAAVLAIAAVAVVFAMPYIQVQSLKKYEDLPQRRADTAELDIDALRALKGGEELVLSDGAVLSPLGFEKAVSLGGQVDDFFKEHFGFDEQLWDGERYSIFLYQKDHALDGTGDCPFAAKARALFFIEKDGGCEVAEVLPLESEMVTGKYDCRWTHFSSGRDAAEKNFPSKEVMLFNAGQFEAELHLPFNIRPDIRLGFLKIGAPPLYWYSDSLRLSSRYVCV